MIRIVSFLQSAPEYHNLHWYWVPLVECHIYLYYLWYLVLMNHQLQILSHLLSACLLLH